MLLSIDTAPSHSERAHFLADAWRTDDKDLMPEIVIRAQDFALGSEDVLATLLHECAHALSHARGMVDCDHNQRHNRVFARHAEELGLTVKHLGWRGWAGTKLSQTALNLYADELARLAAAINLSQVPHGPASRGENLQRYGCGCQPQRTMRMWPTAFALAPVTCGACGRRFEPARRSPTRPHSRNSSVPPATKSRQPSGLRF